MQTNAVRVQSVLKWAGGKQALAFGLVQRFPDAFDRYYEPFLGGASVFLAVGRASAVLSDHNEWLIETYRAIRDCPERVIERLDGMINTREEFMRHRSIDWRSLDVDHRAALLIYLNKTCFRGLFRVNRKGQFNVPYGAYDRRYYDRNNVLAFSYALRDVELRHGDFEFGADGIQAGDFAYFDPPYYKLGGYSDFNRYTAGQFREGDHYRLAAFCRELDDRGVRWAVSNSDTDFVKALYDGFIQTPITARREINLKSANRTVQELLITNYEPSRDLQATLF